ncbi:carboxymuconolactone decarboxylase family protein [Kitasatospora sp. NPDC006786]|uniref:carboxymuconolactone decarboxylase family protein n=1 Tax=unclassified Kitasatospora TaxID=2633591 RepID=UPI0033DE53F5
MSPATVPTGTDLTPAPTDRTAGYALLAELAGPGAATTLGGLDALAPGFPDWIVTSLFGGTYQRPGLALRDRQIANLAALTALGGVEPQLADHVRYSRRIGLTEAEITEVIVHLAPYVGLPRALAGLRVATAAFADATFADATFADAAARAEAKAGTGTGTEAAAETVAGSATPEADA